MIVGIWIKSQDGSLGEYTHIFPSATYKRVPDPEGTPFDIYSEEVLEARIMGRATGYVDLLGTYPTDAQAKRVLNEIASHIGETHYRVCIGEGSDPIYYMPPAESEA